MTGGSARLTSGSFTYALAGADVAFYRWSVGTVLAFAVTFALLLHEIRLRSDEVCDQEKRRARLDWVDSGGMGTQTDKHAHRTA